MHFGPYKTFNKDGHEYQNGILWPQSQTGISCPYCLSPGDRIFKMLVSIPHNTPLIMEDRHNNFEDPITWTQEISKTKFDLLGFF